MGSNGNAHGAQPLRSFFLGAQAGAREVPARGGCKQALRASRCPQAPPVHPPVPSEPSVPWGNVRQLRQLKGHFNPPSGDPSCGSSCPTCDTSSLPGPTGGKQEVCSLPFPLQSHAPSLSLLGVAHSQLDRVSYPSSFPSRCTRFPPACSWEGRLLLSPVSPELTR